MYDVFVTVYTTLYKILNTKGIYTKLGSSTNNVKTMEVRTRKQEDW